MNWIDYTVIAIAVVAVGALIYRARQSVTTQTAFDRFVYDIAKKAFIALPGSTDDEKLAYVIDLVNDLWLVKKLKINDDQIRQAAWVALLTVRKEHEKHVG